MKSCGLCACGKALFAVNDPATGKQVGTTHLGTDDDHHMQVFGSMHVRLPHAEPDPKQTDLCVCGHIRGSHMEWATATDCLGGPDEHPCACDAFDGVL